MEKIKILVVTSDIPYPLNMGGNVAQFVFSDYLRHHIDITYIFEIHNFEDEYNVKILEELWQDVEIVKVFAPSYYSQNKMTLTKRAFRKLSHIFGHIAEGSKPKTENKGDANGIFSHALWYIKPLTEQYIAAICNTIEAIKPDLIQVEHSRLLSLANLNTGKIPKIFIDHEVQFRMLEAAADSTTGSNFTDYNIELTRNVEVSLLKKFDYLFTFSEQDKASLIYNGCKNVDAIAFPLLPSDFKQINTVTIEKLVFVGGDFHYPNYDAVDWYVNALGKEIYEKFGLKLHVIGKWRTQNIKKLKRDYLIFEGYVEDLYEATKNSINIMPIRMGAGIRTKLLSALAFSQPIITTTIGADGINISHGKHAFICDSKSEFFDAIASFLNDPVERINIQNQAHLFAKSNFSQDVLGNKRLKAYKEILSRDTVL